MEDSQERSEEDDFFDEYKMRFHKEKGKPKKWSKGQAANHLLNFNYPQAPPTASFEPHHRSHHTKIVPFKKERFLQAKFAVNNWNGEDYEANKTNPDKFINWDSVEQVFLQAKDTHVCPICLDPPIAAKVSKCGHVFCWSCIIRHLSYAQGNKFVGNCPICFETIQLKDMKSAVVDSVRKYAENNFIKLTLFKRSKKSVIIAPISKWNQSTSSELPRISDAESPFNRYSIISDISPILQRESEQLEAAAKEAASAEEDSLPFIIAAQEQLQDRKEKFLILKSLTGSVAPLLTPSSTEATSSTTSSASVAPSTAIDVPTTNHHRVTKQAVAVSTSPVVAESPSEESLSSSWDAWSEPSKYESENSTLLYEDEKQDVPVPEPAEDIPSSNGHQKAAADATASTDANSTTTPSTSTPAAPSTSGVAPSAPTEVSDEYLYFYQASDAQQIYLHPLDLRILLQHYGTYEAMPETISAPILELEEFTLADKLRKRYKHVMGHVPLSSTVQFVEVDMRRIVSRESLKPFYEELNKRFRRRKTQRRKLAQEQQEAAKNSKSRPVPRFAPKQTPPIPIVHEDVPLASSSAEMSSSPSSTTSPNVAPTTSPATPAVTSSVPSYAAAASGATLYPPISQVYQRPQQQQQHEELDEDVPQQSKIELQQPVQSFLAALKSSKKDEVKIPPNAVSKKSKTGKQYVILATTNSRNYKM